MPHDKRYKEGVPNLKEHYYHVIAKHLRCLRKSAWGHLIIALLPRHAIRMIHITISRKVKMWPHFRLRQFSYILDFYQFQLPA